MDLNVTEYGKFSDKVSDSRIQLTLYQVSRFGVVSKNAHKNGKGY